MYYIQLDEKTTTKTTLVLLLYGVAVFVCAKFMHFQWNIVWNLYNVLSLFRAIRCLIICINLYWADFNVIYFTTFTKHVITTFTI